MRELLLEVLACIRCAAPLRCDATERAADGEIESGRLACSACGASYPIVRGIPRFVPADNYARSFGFQWNTFRTEQIDSLNGTTLSARRFAAETGWTADWLRGKWILEAGCGDGRFLDIASRADCQVVGLDLSDSVDAVRATLRERPNLHLVQASIFDPPFRAGSFDGCYSIGVLQHTPAPLAAIAPLARLVKDGGRIAVTVYELTRATLLQTKYLLRPLTRRMKAIHLLAIVRFLMPLLFPLTDVLFRLPLLGRAFHFVIPVVNRVEERSLTRDHRYRLAIMETFDLLAPRYDTPLREDALKDALAAAGLTEIRRLPNRDLNVVAGKSLPA